MESFIEHIGLCNTHGTKKKCIKYFMKAYGKRPFGRPRYG
jgi:hypothetical protein